MMNVQEKHILFISVPAYGHVIPLLELARKVSKFHQVTFAVSAKMVGDLPERELFDEKVDSRITMYPIADGVETAMEGPANKDIFKKVMPMIFRGIMKLVHSIPISNDPSFVSELKDLTRPVDGIITDNFIGTGAGAMTQRKIPLYLFSSGPVSFTWVILSVHAEMATGNMDDLDGFMEVPDEEGNFKKTVPAELLHSLLLPVQKILPQCHAVIVNSVCDLESEMIRRCKSKPGMQNVPFFCIGPILPETKKAAAANATIEQKVSTWLDGKDPESVVYISFGSVVKTNQAQVEAIAGAIKQLDQPAIWSLKASDQQYVPEDLKSATNMDDPSSKVLILTWAPQKTILSHGSMGVFVSHCGWNSTMEGLAAGKPIVGWPQFADQNINAEFVAEHNAGDVIRNAGSHKGARMVPPKEIISMIKNVQKNNTEGARTFAQKLHAALQPDGSSSKQFAELVSYIAST
ncbi:hypothetical protein RvY_10535-1 [Ramazzottius varieornatus]|uniref:UDP-glucuronosyltransferase n=1 Tax=Ramazzottius varieornatus TaxID=947166 RepID=A0A1D1VM30_RAMVA|nr:hypothetical protein RvY_10535-1 [Ramazzottius varieornatus]